MRGRHLPEDLQRRRLLSATLAIAVASCAPSNDAASPSLGARPASSTPSAAGASAAPGASAGTSASAGARAAGAARCPSSLDARALLAKHARAYGSPDAVVASLPVVFSGAVTLEGKTGKVETVLTREHYRSQAYVAGVYGASGVDAAGPWTMDGGSGVLERLSPAEGIDPIFDAWVLRRAYVGAFDPARDAARCEESPSGTARVDVTYKRPELGAPTLSFDLESGALLSLLHRQSDGKPMLTTIESWSDADPKSGGARWPRRVTDHPVAGSAPTSDFSSTVHDLACVRIDVTGVALPEKGATCVAAPANRFSLRWPGEGLAGVVRVPMSFHGSELFVRVKVGGREVWALLDSGASITAIDAGAPIASSFTPTVDMTGSGATQKVRFGVGEIAAIELGPLRAERVPVASVPIPALDAFGEKRPELILGYSFFVSAAIRVDYAHEQIALARTSDSLLAKNAQVRSVPMRVLHSKMVADGLVEGASAPFELDTGNAGGLDLYKKWASAHDLPGSRPTLAMKGRFGVGAGETTSVFFRFAHASLGPIRFDDHVAHVSDPPDPGDIAGLAGNDVLSRCDAVVFDHGKRTLFVEGACERKTAERKMGWRFERRPDPAVADRPWVVASLLPGSAAERAGIRLGDRVIDVGGKPATAAVEQVWSVESQPEGTKVPVTVLRDGKRERVVVELRSLLR